MKKIGLIVLAATIASGCSSPQISLSSRAGSSTALTAANSSALVSGPVTITGVKLVIRRVRLEPVVTTDGGSSPGEDELAVGPFLIELSGTQLDSGALTRVFDADVTAGTYHQVKFEIHKVEDADAAANPQLAPMAGKSVEITGSGANGSFTFSSSLSEEQEREGTFDVGTGTSNITLNVDMSGWFTAPNTDPSVPGYDRSALENAIKASIDIYDDDDRDGLRDHP